MNSFYRIIFALFVVICASNSAQAQIDWGDGSSGDWNGGTDVNITPGTGTGLVTSLQLSASRLLLSGGETAQLVAIVNADAANKKVTWSVVDSSIATVSDNGLVTALTTGQTVVTATAVDGGLKAQCLVTVKNNALVYVERIELDKTELTMYVGETALITPTIYPASASNKKVVWESEICQDLYIPCTINQEGFATAVKPGKITYVARPQDGADVAGKVQITVKDKPVSSITLPSTISLDINEMKTLNPVVTPELIQPMFHWTTANPSIAYVNSSGRIIGCKTGETTVTATAIDGTGKSCTARVVVSGNEANWGYSGWVLERGENVHPWTARYYNEHDVFSIEKDNSGKAWYELGYDDSSWRYGYGPMAFYGWSGYAASGQWNDPRANMFIRQEFYIADVSDYDFNFYGGIWDGDGSIYLNGKKISVANGMAQLDRSQLNMGGMNVIAIAINARYDNWTPSIDFGIHYEESVPVSRVILSEKQLTLPQCATHKLNAIVKPNEATRPNLTWKSSDEQVARVRNDGTVLTICPGKAVISACATDGSGVVGTCQVTVTEEFGTEENLPLLPRGSVLLSYVGENYNTLPKDEAGNDCTNMDFDDSQWKPAQLAMVYQHGDEYFGETYFFRYKFFMPDVKGKYVLRMDSWFTGRSKFWINGVLIGEIHEHEGHQRDIPAELLNYGGENILTVSRHADGQFIFDCWMDLFKIVPVESVTLSQTSVTLDQEQQIRLEAYVKPDNAYNREVRWTSDNPTIASVDDWGNVTGMGEGIANITATAVDGSGVKATCQVTVTRYINVDGQRVEVKPVTAVTLDKVSVTLKQNQRDKLTATITPSDAYYKEVKWTTSNPDVVTVDQEGNIRGRSAGTAIVTVTNTHGTTYFATCEVTVTDEVMPLQPGDWILPNAEEGSWNAKAIYAPWGHELHDTEPADDANGNSWTTLSYDDDSWQTIEGPLNRDYGNWPDDDSRYYVRRKFVVDDLSGINSFKLYIKHDDNALVYINGTFVAECPDWSGGGYREYLLPKKLLSVGQNIVCVNIYQGGGGAELDFGLMGSDERYIKIVNITYMVDGEAYRTEDVESDSVIELPAAPLKDDYTFYHWEGLPADMIMPDHNLTLTAVYAVRGDVNLDEKVNITDAEDIVNDRLGYESTNFVRVLSDVNRDDQYTITDAIGVLNLMYGEPVGSYAPRRMNASQESLELSLKNNNTVVLDMNCANGYSAFQFDVELPESIVLDGISLNENRCKNFAVRFNKVEGNIYKVVAYNLANVPLTTGDGNLLTLNISGVNGSDKIRLTDIHFSTQKAVDVMFDELKLDMTDGILSHKVSGDDVEYNVTGLHVSKAYRGIVIVNGKKIIRK